MAERERERERERKKKREKERERKREREREREREKGQNALLFCRHSKFTSVPRYCCEGSLPKVKLSKGAKQSLFVFNVTFH